MADRFILDVQTIQLIQYDSGHNKRRNDTPHNPDHPGVKNMSKKVKTVQGITITAFYDWEWHGSYSTGEWREDILWYCTDSVCEELGRRMAQCQIPTRPPVPLPPLPWEPEHVAAHEERVRAAEEAYKEECEAKGESIKRQSEFASAIKSRRAYLKDLFNSQ